MVRFIHVGLNSSVVEKPLYSATNKAESEVVGLYQHEPENQHINW